MNININMPEKIGDYYLGQKIDSTKGLIEFSKSEYMFSKMAGMSIMFENEKWFNCNDIFYNGILWKPTIGTLNGEIYKIALQQSFEVNTVEYLFSNLCIKLLSVYGNPSQSSNISTIWDVDFGNLLVTKRSSLGNHFVSIFFTSNSISNNVTKQKKKMSGIFTFIFITVLFWILTWIFIL